MLSVDALLLSVASIGMSPCWVTLVDSESRALSLSRKAQGSRYPDGVPRAGDSPSVGTLCPVPCALSEVGGQCLQSLIFCPAQPISGPERVKTCDSVGKIACCRASIPDSTRQLYSRRLFRAILDATPFDALHACRYRFCSSWRLCFRESRNPRIGPPQRPVSSANHQPTGTKLPPDSTRRLEQSPLTSSLKGAETDPATSVAVPPGSPYRRFTAGTTARITTAQAHLTRDGPVVCRDRHRLQSCPSLRSRRESMARTETTDANRRRHRYQLLRIITSRPLPNTTGRREEGRARGPPA
jgi:hypothetical protein